MRGGLSIYETATLCRCYANACSGFLLRLSIFSGDPIRGRNGFVSFLCFPKPKSFWKKRTGNFGTAKSMGSGSDGGKVFGTP